VLDGGWNVLDEVMWSELTSDRGRARGECCGVVIQWAFNRPHCFSVLLLFLYF